MQQKMRGRIAFARVITNYKVRNEKKAYSRCRYWLGEYNIYYLFFKSLLIGSRYRSQSFGTSKNKP
jgi:hypothetical protein